MLAIALCIAAFTTAAPSSSADGRSVALSPATGLKAGDTTTVSWSGFTPGPVYLYECTADATRWSQCAEVTYVKGTTGPDGTGSVQFPIWRGVPIPQIPVVGSRNFGIPCNAQNPCKVVVSECQFDIDGDRAAGAGIGFTPGGENPAVTTTTGFATTTSTVPTNPPVDADPIPTAYTGSAQLFVSDAAFTTQAAPYELNIDLLLQNSPNALEQFVSGSAEVAITSLGPDAEQLEALAEADRDIAYVPIAASALTVGQQLHVNGIEAEHANFSADVLSRIYHAPVQGDTWTQIGDWNEPSVVEGNGGCGVQMDGRRYPVASFRGDVSAANQVFTRWLAAEAPTWELGSGLNMPINDSQVYGRPSAAELADFIAFGDLKIDHATNSAAGRVGFVDRSYAREFGLTQAGLRNGAGEYVQPTDDAVRKAIEATHEPGTFFVPDVDTTVPGAYPMPTVYYAVVQTNVTDTFTQENVDDLKTFLTYMTSSQGQARAQAFGYVPLPTALQAEATATIAKIGTTGGEEPTPPPTEDPEEPTFFDELLGGFDDYASTFSDDYGSSFDDSTAGDTGGYSDTGYSDTGTAGADGGAAAQPATGEEELTASPIRAVFGSVGTIVGLPMLLALGVGAAIAGQVLRRRSGATTETTP
ncbi:MAG: neocarzinostatin apoprotein domain-containing protein [Acidimicrobiales bacterium]